MPRLKIDIDVRVAQVKIEAIRKAFQGSIPKESLTAAADRMLKFLQLRFKKGGGNPSWPALSVETLNSKTRRGAPLPRAKLREFDTLYNNLEKRIYKRSVLVGYISNRKHSTPNRTTPTEYNTTRKLAELHAQVGTNTPNLPPRKIVVGPSTRALRDIRRFLVNAINKNTPK